MTKPTPHRLRRSVEARVLDEACLHERAASGRHLLGDMAKLSAAMVVAHLLVDNPAHEIGHWLTAFLLGIRWDPVREAFVSTLGATGSAGAVAIVYLAGGLFSGTLLSLLAFVVPAPWRNGILPLAASEFAYAPFDSSGVGDAVGRAAVWAGSAWILLVYVRNYLEAVDEPVPLEDSAAEAIRRTRFVECLARFRLDTEGKAPSAPGPVRGSPSAE